MDRRILYIFDEASDAQRLIRQLKAGGVKVYLAPVTTNGDIIDGVRRSLGAISGAQAVMLDFVGRFNRKAFEEKENFIRFITDFSARPDVIGKSLREYFRYPSSDFSVWWFSVVAEKNTAKTDSFHTMVQLLTLRDICLEHDCREVFIDLGNAALAGSVRENARSFNASCVELSGRFGASGFFEPIRAVTLACKHFLVSLGRAVFVKIYNGTSRKRKEELKKRKFLLITHFPYLDHPKLKEGTFINKYYEPLHRALRREKKDSYAWLALFVSRGGFNWKESVALGRRVNECDAPLIFCEEWLRLSDWFLVLFHYAALSMKYLLIYRRLSKMFVYPEGDVNLWSIFRRDWNDSFCGYSLVEGLLYYRIFERLSRSVADGAVITYIAEMHPWEKALNAAFRERRDVSIVGIQHTIVPLLLLMYFNDKRDLKYRGLVDTMPKPDYLACVGEIPRKIFIESGWDEKRVVSWGAIRFQHFKRYLESDIPWKGRDRNIIVALSIMPREAAELFMYVYQALKGAGDFKVIVKLHPFLPAGEFRHAMGSILDDPRFVISESPLDRLLANARALIVRGSSASLEAIAQGCPVIIPRLASVVDMNPLSGLSDLPIYVESPEELRTAVRRVLMLDEPPFSRDRSRNFIKEYCNLADSDNDFMERLEAMVRDQGIVR